MWRALDVFTEGDRSTTADIRKNLIAIVFNSHFLSMSELLIEPRTAQILYMISANKTASGQDPFVILYLSVSELGKYILKQEKKKKIVWSEWYKQPATKTVIAIRNNSLTYVFNLCIEKNVFPPEAKVVPLPKGQTEWFRFQNLRIIQLQQIIEQYHFCLFCQSFSKSMCSFI